MSKWVYSFGAGHKGGGADMKNLLGGRGRTWPRWPRSACPSRRASPSRPRSARRSTRTTSPTHPELKGQVRAALALVEKAMDLRFGDAAKALLVSVAPARGCRCRA